MLGSDLRNCDLGFSNSFALKWTKKNIVGRAWHLLPIPQRLYQTLLKAECSGCVSERWRLPHFVYSVSGFFFFPDLKEDLSLIFVCKGPLALKVAACSMYIPDFEITSPQATILSHTSIDSLICLSKNRADDLSSDTDP